MITQYSTGFGGSRHLQEARTVGLKSRLTAHMTAFQKQSGRAGIHLKIHQQFIGVFANALGKVRILFRNKER